MIKIVEDICTEKTLEDIRKIDFIINGVCDDIDEYFDRYAGLSESCIVFNKEKEPIGYAIISRLSKSIYSSIKDGMISNVGALSPLAYEATRGKDSRLLVMIRVIDEDYDVESCIAEHLRLTRADARMLMLSDSRSFADNFEIKYIAHTAHNGVEVIEFIV